MSVVGGAGQPFITELLLVMTMLATFAVFLAMRVARFVGLALTRILRIFHDGLLRGQLFLLTMLLRLSLNHGGSPVRSRSAALGG